jgi:hypothetical protein
MKIFSILALSAVSASAASVSYSFWAYDQAAGSTAYYSHYQVGSSTDDINPFVGDPSMARIDLNNFNSNVATSIEGSAFQVSASRSVGWHKYEFNFDDATSTATILLNATPIHSAALVQTPGFFRFIFHDYFGGIQESVIDDFEYRVDGNLVYTTSFEDSSLDSNWIISRQDAGTYIASGDSSHAHTGSGGLALGDTNSNNTAVIITFVPEPSSSALTLIASTLLLGRRRR